MRTNFGRCIRQTVEGAALAGRGLAYKADEGIAGHFLGLGTGRHANATCAMNGMMLSRLSSDVTGAWKNQMLTVSDGGVNRRGLFGIRTWDGMRYR